jgi:hypothetical protein
MAKVNHSSKSNKNSNKRDNKKQNKLQKRTLKRTNKNKKNNSRSKVMRGGDDGRYALPPSYFGGNQNGYVAKFSELPGAVSQGTVSSDGKHAGPNLYPSMGIVSGGGCGCGGKKSKSKQSKSQHKSSTKSKKSRKSKSQNNKRH